jgi:hypothetical protein
LVFQSFRNFDIPEWISVCIKSVENWAKIQGYSHKIIGDELFDQVPEWFSKRVMGQRHLVSDLARLELAKQYLKEGWDRVVWVDADVYIVNPEKFILDTREPYLFCRELWMTHKDSQTIFSERINNAICAFNQENDFLDFYSAACLRIVNNEKTLSHTSIGTQFLTGLRNGLPLIENTIVLSHYLIKSLYENDLDVMHQYKNRFKHPIYAVNLCLTFRNFNYRNLIFTDEVYSVVISRLNQYLHLNVD